MNRELFVDTSAWIAVSDLRDKYHQVAGPEYNRMVLSRRTFVTTNLVIAETYIIIRRTGGYKLAIRFLHSLNNSPRLQKVYSDASLESTAGEMLEEHSDQDFSYADAVSFAVMRERGIMDVFTFDSHFATMGFQMLPVER